MIQYTIVGLLLVILFCFIAIVLLIRKNVVALQNNKKEVKKSEEIEKYRASIDALLENSTDLIWSIDENLKLSSCNSSYHESTKLFYGTSIKSGSSVLEHLSPDLKARWTELYQRALNGEHFSEETCDDSLGIQFCFDVSFNPIVVNKKVEGVAVFARDITSRKSAEQQLEYKINELNIFMYRATHDLRSPLVSIIGLVQLSREQKLHPELEQYLEMINTSVRKMDNLLIDLVKIINVSQGMLSNDKIDFKWMVDEILMSLSHRPGFSQIIFRKHIYSEEHFYADSGLLYSVLQNVIDNAIKYRKQENGVESIVIITIDSTITEIKIGITDNGIGVQEALLNKVFDLFFRGTSISDGTGLGLYIVKTAVEKMGGKIILNSVFKKGTSVNIVFPKNKLL
ncbi:hypothetical protein BH10BAC1_BH10BAC1_11850 [soil metagenome]